MKKLSLLKRICRIILLVYIGFGLVLYFFQNSYIYLPDQTDFANCTSFSESEKVTSGLTRMYFTNRSPDKVIVFYHGNAGRACDRDYLDSFFAGLGYSTVFVEYVGYGEKDVKPSISKILGNVLDVDNFLKTKHFKEVTVMGESIGVGLAAYHASQFPVSNLILITAYNNFASVVFSHYPVYPIKLLLKNNYTPDKWLNTYTGPVTVILAEKDEIVPNKLGQKLYTGLQSREKKLFTIEDVGHNTIYNSPDFYVALEKAFIK